MTDEDLLKLLAEKSHRELTSEELVALQQRAHESAAVRQAVLEAVQWESQLAAAFGHAGINIDKLWMQAEMRPVERRRGNAKWWWSLVGLTACLLLAVWFWSPARRAPMGEDIATIDENPSALSPTSDAASTPEADPSSQALMTAASPDPEVPVDPTEAAMTPSAVATTTGTTEAREATPAWPDGPWSNWLAADAIPLATNDPRNVGDLRSMGLDQLTLAEFQAWWNPIPGQPANHSQDKIGQRPTLNLDGLWTLRAPWLPDTHLKLTPFDVREIILFFWQGPEGVALRFYREREPHTWAAFRVRRNPGETQPTYWGLLTTDSGAFYRSGAATWDVSCHDNQLRLSTGGMTLLTVPYAESPQEVVLQAQTRLRGFQWVRAEPWSSREQTSGPSVLTMDRPADADWQTSSTETAMLQRDVDGGLRLTSTDKEQVVRAYLPIEAPGLFETLLQVSEADPGTGVFLGNETGQPIGWLTFCRDRRTQQITVVPLPGYEKRTESDYDLRVFPPPYFVPETWFRVTAGLGNWQTWCSADRQHWGRLAENPVRGVPGAVRTVGLFCLPGDTPRTIRLQDLEVRRLPGFAPLLANLQETEFPEIDLKQTRTLDDWLAQGWTVAAKASVPIDDWHDARAVRTLEAGPAPELAQALLERLVKSSPRLPADERLQFFDDALALVDTWSDDKARLWERAYADIASDGVSPDQQVLAEALWNRWLQAPLWSYHRGHAAFDAARVRELLQLAFSGKGGPLAEAARSSYAWTEPAHPDQTPRDSANDVFQLARWSRSVAVDVFGVPAPQHHESLPISWRPPWSTQLNKEAYNVQAELLSALESGAYDDACRIVQGIHTTAMSGLLPDAHDSNLYVTLPVALNVALNSHPQWSERLPQQLGPAGDLRWQQVMAHGDVASMQSLTMQFWGTAAAARAHAWGGDRALSLGDPVAALLAYRMAQRTADDSLRSELMARQQLAERAVGLPSNREGEVTTFAGVPIAELWPATATDNSSSSRINAAVPELKLMPVPYQLEKLARFDGQSGQNAGRGEYQAGDAFGRQFAIASDQQQLYLSNRFQITAYNKSTGQTVWARGVDQDQGEAHAFAFVPMVPVVYGQQLLARRLTKGGIELASLQTTDGQVQWTMQPGEKSHVLSDPLVIGKTVWVLTGVPGDQDHWEVLWTQIDPSRGEVITSVPLTRLRPAWDQELPVSVAHDGLDLVANIGNLVLKFDLAGQVQWLWRELWLPPKIDPLEHNQRVTPPIIQDNRVYLSPFNSRRVVCLDLAMGQEIWASVVPDSQGLIAVRDTGLLVAVPDGYLMLEPETGRQIWRQEIDRPLQAVAWSGDRITALAQLPRKDKRGWLQAIVIDAISGQQLQAIPWYVPEGDDYRAGPWFSIDETIWLMVGHGFREPHRDIMKLVPVTAASTVPKKSDDWPAWTSAWPAEAQRALQLCLPGWQGYGLDAGQISYSTEPVRGKDRVMLTKLNSRHTLRLVQSLPVDQPTICRVIVGHEPGQSWRLSIWLQGNMLHTVDVTSPQTSDNWLSLEFPLPAVEGAAGIVEVRAETIDGKPATAAWHHLSVSPVSRDADVN
ncbi:PQQ-binding-like beta-propeller repeat protein [bacterium]|nr:PQQ-binding-like beta-propeller repeat protein [bacterium]